jgi:hypothetical protein
MPTSVSHDPAAPHSSATPTISAKGHLVTGSGFLPDHHVTIWITRAGEDIDDYLAYVTDGHGYLDCELPSNVTGTLSLAATDHRRDPDGACGLLWSNACILVVAEP